jgi:hypothetical protein
VIVRIFVFNINRNFFSSDFDFVNVMSYDFFGRYYLLSASSQQSVDSFAITQPVPYSFALKHFVLFGIVRLPKLISDKQQQSIWKKGSFA